jgi:transposase-like protein
VTLSDEVECDEAYVIAGHKGQPEVVKSKGRQGRRRRLKGKAGRGTLEKERPPVFGMMQRGGQVVIKLMANVKQKTIEPFIKDTIVPGTLVYTDEYSIYARLQSWGYGHKRVNHGLRCLNRFLSVDRFLDSRCQSRLSSAWRGGIFKASGASRTSQLRPIEFFITN